MANKTQLHEAKLAVDRAQGLLNAARTDKDNPERLIREIERLESERSKITERIERLATRLKNVDEVFEDARQNLLKVAQDYKQLKHARKIAQIKRLKEQIEKHERELED